MSCASEEVGALQPSDLGPAMSETDQMMSPGYLNVY